MTDNEKNVLQALSMDLLRVALGRHRGSHQMADRFTEEAKARLSELTSTNPKIIVLIRQSLTTCSSRQAEDLLMYSTIIRNRSLAS